MRLQSLACILFFVACTSLSGGHDDSLGSDVELADDGGKADGGSVTVVTSNAPLQATTLKRIACHAIAGAYRITTPSTWTETCRDDFTFTVTKQTRSNLYRNANDDSPITWKLEVDVVRASPAMTWRVDLTRAISPDWRLAWKGAVVRGDNHDAFLRQLADGLGEYLDVEDPMWAPYLTPTTLVAMPVDVRAAAERELQRQRDARVAPDTAEFSEAMYAIERDGQIVGYLVGIDLLIDDSQFDGAGYWLYFDTSGRLVEQVEWSA